MTLARGQVPHEEMISLRRAHDVRRLRTCGHCGMIGDSAHMIPWMARDWFHGRCYADKFGVDALLELHPDLTEGLQIGDLGVALMKQLCNR